MQETDTQFLVLDKNKLSEVEECAKLMSASEPWVTLKRTFGDVIGIIEDDTSEVHLVKAQKRMIGFAIIKMRGAFVGYVQSVVIDPRYRGKGIGARFIVYLEQRIFSEQPNVFICVSSFNHEAKRLYEKLGYETIGELKDYIVHGHSEILMRKTISPLSEFHPCV
ncbi:MAG: GNAT family N-acetyltransferase [candidate division WOR-3 bacterium]|nr:MAG: GNAT family N-acetyltransferase [candidate division WOR-3 bacterium]